MRWLSVLFLCALAFGQEILRPTGDIDPGNTSLGCSTIGNKPSSSMKASYDAAGLTTFSSLLAVGDNTSAHSSTRVFLTWQSTTNAYTDLNLNINASFAPSQPANGCIKYSIDGGLTFSDVKCDTGQFVGQQTFVIALAASQNLAKLRVSACVVGGKGNAHAEVDPGLDRIVIWDIWTSGTNPAQGAGNGSTSGQAHRGVVVSN